MRIYKQDLVLSPGRSPEDAEAEVQLIHDMAQKAFDRGAEEWSLRVGNYWRFTVAVVREVGPPFWKFPSVRISRKGKGVFIGIGWRYTAYSFYVRSKKRSRNGN